MEEKNKIFTKRPNKTLIVYIAAAFLAGWILSGVFQGSGKKEQISSLEEEEQTVIWTCSMHPQIQLPKPGQCPICGMDLIPLESEEAGSAMPSERRLVMSPEAAKLAEIQTRPVERKFVSTEINMVGKVAYDETKTAYITAWTSGRIDRLYIDQTGIPVRKGDHLAYLYSPELLSAQEEYLQALQNVGEVKESHLDIIRSTSKKTVQNAREKLKLLGVTEEQIQELEERREPSDHMTIFSPVQGIVVQREVEVGDYVKTGTRIYSIVDLSQVWINLDAYESDLQWLRYGQDVTFEAEAYPGELFHGRISLIHPVLDKATQTVKVRVNVKNPEGKLKPGMFVRAKVTAHIAEAGKVMDENLAGKWICPMHPEVIEEQTGQCPICEMDLVEADTLGFVDSKKEQRPLVVSASAVLKTGKRAVVYVRLPGGKPAFEGREILVGPRAGDYYLVKSGLKEGELVVTNGNFKIDSALQIQAKPSMMNPEGGVSSGGHDHGESGDAKKEVSEMKMEMAPDAFLKQLTPLYAGYFTFQDGLAKDDLQKAKAGIEKIKEKLSSADMQLLSNKLHAKWMEVMRRIENNIRLAEEAKTLDELRSDVLQELSGDFIALEKTFSHTGEEKHYQFFCPMALDNKGGSWLQNHPRVMNPYFGEEMLQCGELKKEFISMGNTKVNSEKGGGESHAH